MTHFAEYISRFPETPHQENLSIDDNLNDLTTIFFNNRDQFADYGNLVDALLSLDNLRDTPIVVTDDDMKIHSMNYLNSPISDVTNSDAELLAAILDDRFQQIPHNEIDTRITTELTEAITTFLENLNMAITDFIEDLQEAFMENPALVLLFLLPLLFLLFQLFQNSSSSGYGHQSQGYGGGGDFHKRKNFLYPQYLERYRNFQNSTLDTKLVEIITLIQDFDDKFLS